MFDKFFENYPYRCSVENQHIERVVVTLLMLICSVILVVSSVKFTYLLYLGVI